MEVSSIIIIVAVTQNIFTSIPFIETSENFALNRATEWIVCSPINTAVEFVEAVTRNAELLKPLLMQRQKCWHVAFAAPII